ncbi:MAG: TIR domain-containing protein, partial [Candidatus Omnitrophica bacterium]|nr:TIR domain-containing protein [Candidatus Omnitrophota bacterium]
HYERDVWRANVVRNSWVAKPDREEAGFIDAAEFEKLQRQGNEGVKRWINSQIDGTSVACEAGMPGKKKRGLGEMNSCPPALFGWWVSPKATRKSKFSVRISVKVSSDFNQKVPLGDLWGGFELSEGVCSDEEKELSEWRTEPQ